MLDDKTKERIETAKQRAWDEMTTEERNTQSMMYGRRSPHTEKSQIESNNNGTLLVAGYIVAILIYVIFF